MENSFFRKLSKTEEQAFRAWARENYGIAEPISEVWHPVIRDECRKINEEWQQKTVERTGSGVFVVAVGNAFDGIVLYGPFNQMETQEWQENVQDAESCMIQIDKPN
jgi:hypothetical protein